MTFGFIGAGNMVSAIVKGMTLGENAYAGEKIYITSKSVSSAEVLAKLCGANVCQTASEVILHSDVIILGVKPHVLSQILPTLHSAFSKKTPLVLSLAAGKSLSFLADLLPTNTPIIRVMPNINAKIGASTSGMCANALVTDEHKTLVKEMFQTVGTITEIPENQFSIFSAIGGASVAFAYLYMDALAHAAVKAGMPKQQALELSAQTVCGSAKMILESGEAPWVLIDQVCSPAGTTIEGIASLQKDGFETAIMNAFDAVLAKDKEIGTKK